MIFQNDFLPSRFPILETYFTYRTPISEISFAYKTYFEIIQNYQE